MNQFIIAQTTEFFGISIGQIIIWLVALLVVLLLVRLIRRFWPKRSPKPVTPKPTPAPQPQSVVAQAENLDYDSPLMSSQTSLRYAGKERSWTSQSLFGENQIEENQLPRVEPGDLPIADNSDYVFGGLTPGLAALLPESDQRKKSSKQELISAGYYQPHAWQNLAAIRYLGIILPILFFGSLLVLAPARLEVIFLVGLIVGPILGWSLPRLHIRSRARQRRFEIEKALPDVLDLLNMCVSQGLTLQSSLKRVGVEIQDVYPAMSQELKIVSHQAEIGSLEQALLNMNDRVEVPEIHSFSSLLIQTERMGTSVSDALGDYSDGMRETLKQRADQKANTASFKLLFPTVLCLMPAVFMFLLGPAVVELADFFNGTNELDTAAEQFRQFTGQQ